MPATYEPIATTTVSGGSTNTITFNSIPGTYTDLRLICNYSLTGGSALFVTVNNNTSSIYSSTEINADGSLVQSSRRTNFDKFSLSSNGTERAFHDINFFSYAGSTNKTCLISQSLDKNTSGYLVRYVGLAQTTSAITRIDLALGNPEFFTSGSVFTLFGIKAA